MYCFVDYEIEKELSMGDTGSAALAFSEIGMIFPDGTETLQNISFSVDKGEFVTVVGPSGCGKSTLLKIWSVNAPTSRNSCAITNSFCMAL